MAEFHQKLRSGLLFPLNKFKHTLYSLPIRYTVRVGRLTVRSLPSLLLLFRCTPYANYPVYSLEQSLEAIGNYSSPHTNQMKTAQVNSNNPLGSFQIS